MEFCIFTEPQEGATYDDQLELAQLTERLGFDGFFRSDHYLPILKDGLPGPTDAWTTLAGLARETQRIRLGTLVSSMTFRLPGILAVQVAQIDQMSGGRIELGLGTGWYEAEHTAYGIPFPGKRFGPWEEQLQILTGLWSTPEGETFSFEGEHYTLTNSPARPKPVQSPIPLIVGGSGPAKTPRLAAEFATEYNTWIGEIPELGPKIDRVRAACERIGRDPSSLKLSAVGTTAIGSYPAVLGRRAHATTKTVDALRATGFAGSSAEVIDKVGALADLGFGRIYFQIMDFHDPDLLEIVASEVVNHFR